MTSMLRPRSALAFVAALVALGAVGASSASCGGDDSNAAGADGGSGDGTMSGEGAMSSDGSNDGTSGGDAGDPCAADTSGTSRTSSITAAWANEGGDKVTQDELRVTGHPSAAINSVFDGRCIKTFGAKNEVVSFNLVLEAATSKATKVTVRLGDFTGPGGTVLRSAPRANDKLFDFTTTEVELFYVRYLQIKGLSQQAYGAMASWQEATFPKRAQCPGMTQATPDSKPTGAGCAWTQRPIANKFVPDIAVPLELVPTFDIAASANQSIWADVYVPKTAPAGVYGAMLTVSENGTATHKIPVSLRVRDFALPDAPSATTMLFTSLGDIRPRYGAAAQTALVNQRLVAHRHRISLIGDDASQTGTQPGADYLAVLDGSFFTAQHGYAGPGAGTGQDVYSIGTYGGLTEGSTQAAFTSAFNAWETWFEASSPKTERFVYLCDEIACQQSTPTLTTQLQWWRAITGVGSKLHTLATQNLLDAPSALSNPTSSWPFSQGVSSGGTTTGGTTAADQAAADAVVAAEPARRIFAYNGARPGAGSIATEDDGVALREQPWGQYKKRIDRWFWWEATYYDDNQQGLGRVDLFTSANTFGAATNDATYGTTGGANGNGVLLYPGTDVLFASSSYGVAGPIASLRLKHWRRGLEDVDYIALAAAKDPAAVTAIVNRMVPRVLWEAQCHDPATDCSYTYAPISWSDKPDDWEAARAELAHIIDGQ